MDRSYHGENRPSHQHWVRKHHWARLVVWSGTTCEALATIRINFGACPRSPAIPNAHVQYSPATFQTDRQPDRQPDSEPSSWRAIQLASHPAGEPSSQRATEPASQSGPGAVCVNGNVTGVVDSQPSLAKGPDSSAGPLTSTNQGLRTHQPAPESRGRTRQTVLLQPARIASPGNHTRPAQSGAGREPGLL